MLGLGVVSGANTSLAGRAEDSACLVVFSPLCLTCLHAQPLVSSCSLAAIPLMAPPHTPHSSVTPVPLVTLRCRPSPSGLMCCGCCARFWSRGCLTHSLISLPSLTHPILLPLTQVSKKTIQADVLQLLRQILVTWLPHYLTHLTPFALLTLLSFTQVSSITIQADVLQLLRQILVTWLPRSELIKGVLLQLPHVSPQVCVGGGGVRKGIVLGQCWQTHM